MRLLMLLRRCFCCRNSGCWKSCCIQPCELCHQLIWKRRLPRRVPVLNGALLLHSEKAGCGVSNPIQCHSQSMLLLQCRALRLRAWRSSPTCLPRRRLLLLHHLRLVLALVLFDALLAPNGVQLQPGGSQAF